MDNKQRKGTFFQIWFGIAATCLIVMILSVIATFAIASRHAIPDVMHDLNEKIDTVSALFSRRYESDKAVTASNLFDLQKLANSRVIFVDTSLRAYQLERADNVDPTDEEFELSLVDFELTNSGLRETPDITMVEQILLGQYIDDIQSIGFWAGKNVLSGAPVYSRDSKNVVGAILLIKPISTIRRSVLESFIGLGTAFAISILLTILAARFTSIRFTKPVLELNDTAKRIADGHYGAIALTGGSKEIEELGNSLNHLSLRLDNVIHSLADEKIRLETILGGIGEGIIAVDELGNVIHRNALSSVFMDTDPGNIDAMPDTLRSSFFHAMESHSVGHLSWQTFEDRYIEASIYPIISDDPTAMVKGAVSLMRDASEETRLEQMRRAYIANVSHELRTPLTGIRGMIEPLIDGVMDTEEERQESYSVIYNETIRLQKLISDMLDMSRLQDGRIQIELEEIDVSLCVQMAATRMRPISTDAGVNLCIDLPDEPINCIANEDRVIQVLVILLDNAIRFTPRTGTVTVFAHIGKDGVEVGVHDTGYGIAKEDLPYIWERFFKADRSRMQTSGTGLGLSIARLAVELMHGKIDVETEQGRGSVFTVTLPIV